MKRLHLIIILTFIAALTLAVAAFAAVPQTINYQGYLKNTNGTPVTSATSIRFSLYSSNPARNNPVWTETKSITPSNGVYSTQLGSVTPITAPFDVPYYLGLKLGSDAEMPLQPLASVPYALNASSSTSSTTLSGQTLSQLDMRYLNLATSSLTQQQIATLRWDQIHPKTLTIPVGHYPQGIIFDGSSIWVANVVSDNVMKINPSTGAIIGTYPVGDAPVALAYDGASIWVTNRYPGSVSKLNPATGTIMGIYPVGNGPVALAYDGSSIWVANENDDTVTKLNPTTGAIIGTYPVGNGPVALAYDGSSIWVANSWDNTVTKLNPTTGATIGTYTAGAAGSYPCSLVFDGRNIWVGNDGTDMGGYYVTKINPASGAIIGTYGLGYTFNPASLTFGGRYVWVAGYGAKKIDPDTGAIMGSFDDGVAHQSMAFDGSSIWMTNPNQDSVVKLANAGVQTWDFSVGTAQLATAAVTTSQLADTAVETAKLADGAVIGTKLANGSVASANLADGSVTSAKLADEAVTGTKLANGSVASAKLAGGAVTSAKIYLDGDVSLNQNDLKLLYGDTNHGLGWYGTGKTFDSVNVDGPVLYGWTGGALASINAVAGKKIMMKWNNGGFDFYGYARFRVLSGGSTSACLDGNNSISTCSSDARLKKDVAPLSQSMDVLGALSKLRGVTFTWDKSNEKAANMADGRDLGMIAQEVEQLFPEVVHTDKDGYKSMDYPKLVAFLIEVNKAQQAQLVTQKEETGRLRKMLEEMDRRLSSVEKR